MRPRVRVGGAVLVVALGLAACGGDDDDAENARDDEPSESTTTTADAPTTTLSPEDEVLAAYEAAQDALIAASDPPNPDHPDLFAHYAGDTLARFQSAISRDQSEGVSFVTTIETFPTSGPTVAGDTATFQACVVDRSQLVDTVTREPRGEPGETVRLVTFDLERIDGEWKIVRQEEGGEPCTPG